MNSLSETDSPVGGASSPLTCVTADAGPPVPPLPLSKPNYLPNLNCHVVWLYNPNVVVSQLPYKTLEEKQSFLERLLTFTNEWIRDSKKYLVPRCRAFNQRCMAAAYLAHLSRFGEALIQVKDAEDYLESEEFLLQHRPAYKFLVQANKYCIIKIKSYVEGLGGPQENNLRSIVYDINNNAHQAVIAVAKGILAVELLSREAQVKFILKAITKDPNVAEWHLMLYRAQREKRRESRKGNNGKTPTQREEQAIETAFRLDPNCRLIKASKAEMMDDKYRKSSSPEKEIKAEESFQLFLEALEGNREEKWVRLRLAEVCGYEGLFALCEEERPNSSRVMHKFGRYYNMKGNTEKAREYFWKGVECDGTNYGCLMEYFRSISSDDRKNSLRKRCNMLDIIREKCIPHRMLYHEKPYTDLMQMYGILLWVVGKNDPLINKKRQACECWIDACMKTSHAVDTIVETIRNGVLPTVGTFKIQINEVMAILEEIRFGRGTPETSNVVEKMIERLRSVD